MEALLTLSGIIIGIISTLVFQYYQSKEILKQTLYKEKLTVYKQLLILFNRISTNSYLLNSNPSLVKEDVGKPVLDLQYFLADNIFLINPDIYSICKNFISRFLESYTQNDYKSLIREDFPFRLNNEINKDLGIGTLSKELSELYNGLPAMRLTFKKTNEDAKTIKS